MHLLYGGIYLSWDYFSNTMEQFQSNEMKTVLDVTDLIQCWACVTCSGNTTGLGKRFHLPIALALTADSLRQTHPRDKVYALQGIKSASADLILVPDYEKSVSEVCFDVERYFVAQDEPFTLFAIASNYRL